MSNQRKVIVYICSSIDGFISGPNGDMSFLSVAQSSATEDYGYAQFVQSIDTVILGRKTYDWVMTQVTDFPHQGKETFVVTRTARPSIGTTQFYTDNLVSLVQRLKSDTSKKDIFVDGGADVIDTLLTNDLIDELMIFTLPVMLGDGTRLFKSHSPSPPMKKFSFVTSKFYADTGVVKVHYQRTI